MLCSLVKDWSCSENNQGQGQLDPNAKAEISEKLARNLEKAVTLKTSKELKSVQDDEDWRIKKGKKKGKKERRRKEEERRKREKEHKMRRETGAGNSSQHAVLQPPKLKL